VVDSQLRHWVHILDANGVLKRRIDVGPGVSSYLYSNALCRADFGGVEPGTFRVRIFANREGQVSTRYIEGTVSKTIPGRNPEAFIEDVLFAADPPTIVDANLAAIKSKWPTYTGFPHPSLAGTSSDDVALALQGNLEHFCKWFRTHRAFPVTGTWGRLDLSSSPDLDTQMAFEAIRDVWGG